MAKKQKVFGSPFDKGRKIPLTNWMSKKQFEVAAKGSFWLVPWEARRLHHHQGKRMFRFWRWR